MLTDFSARPELRRQFDGFNRRHFRGHFWVNFSSQIYPPASLTAIEAAVGRFIDTLLPAHCH